MEMAAWEIWVRSTALSHFVLAHELWVWPGLEMLHYFGLSMLFGTVGVFDLRVLGLLKRIPNGTSDTTLRSGRISCSCALSSMHG